ncbi:hypothetical protein Poli38472_014446 [Pythium oligandrum]|uniref:Origin recognition complex subunit 2 n=1 Tax=Pythium oligandrum TaxID=41045 RepID=A0A8K1CD74_PYTOL|nr:hypothetical protein Poli38472_014446 [Pythium oligandrum]|eukprot:TMW60985.1 hypothetical protein Poli38472_014446 [Pythium oligandrum]
MELSEEARRATRASRSALHAHITGEHASEDTPISFGAKQANAYFSARRLRQSSAKSATPKGSKRLKTGGANASKEQNDDEVEESAPRYPFKVLPVSETMEILRVVDAAEADWRQQDLKQAWPTFDQHFVEWRQHLRGGFSVLLHGMGSKLALMQAFAETLPDTAYVVQLHGYLPTIDMKELIGLICQEVLNVSVESGAKAYLKKCRAIADYAFAHRRQRFAHVYVVIHTLDGIGLRDPELQSCFAQLATVPFIRIIASVDNMNAPALWSEADAHRFRWLHYRVDTLRPYAREIDLRLFREGKTAEPSVSGVRYILMSLTPTDVATLRTIAHHQLAASGIPSASSSRGRGRGTVTKGADYHQVYQECNKQLLHATMQSMKNSIKCLEDNGLVLLKRVQHREKLVIPLSDDILKNDILPPSSTTSTNKA